MLHIEVADRVMTEGMHSSTGPTCWIAILRAMQKCVAHLVHVTYHINSCHSMLQ